MFSLKLVFFAVAVASLVLAAEDKQTPEIVTERTNVREDGYDFVFKTSDGVSRKEEGNLITIGDHQGIGVKGSYSYTAPDGQEYEVTFTADDKGYKPTIRVLGSQPQN